MQVWNTQELIDIKDKPFGGYDPVLSREDYNEIFVNEAWSQCSVQASANPRFYNYFEPEANEPQHWKWKEKQDCTTTTIIYVSEIDNMKEIT